MKINNLFNKLENFELHHKILVFLGVTVLTILVSRLSVFIYNPKPIIFNFELHHFDYGILLLMITTLLLLFGDKKYFLYLLLSATSFGIILDDIWFMRGSMIDPNLTEISIYNATFPIVMIFVIALILTIVLINHFRKK